MAEAHDHWELPVDLEWVATVLEGDPIRSHGAFLDLLTGEVIPAFTTDVARQVGRPGPIQPRNPIAGSLCRLSVPVRHDRTWRSLRP